MEKHKSTYIEIVNSKNAGDILKLRTYLAKQLHMMNMLLILQLPMQS